MGSVSYISAFQAEADHFMDCSGLMCPEPVMMLHNKVREISPGHLLEVVATDPSTERDIPKFCRFLGHELVENAAQGNRYHYLIRIGS